MGGGGCGRGRGDFREGEGQKLGRGAEKEVEGNGLTARPPPQPRQSGWVSWSGGRGSAGLIWKPEGRGRAPRETMGLCVCVGECVSVSVCVCVYTEGGREDRGGGGPAAPARAYVRAGAGPGCGERKTKGLLRFPPARGCGGPREGGEQHGRQEPRTRPLPAPPAPLSEQPPDRRQWLTSLFPVLSGHGLPRSEGSLGSPAHTWPAQFPSSGVRARAPQGAQNSTSAPGPRGHLVR